MALRTEPSYVQRDREDWGRAVGACDITIKTPDGAVYTMEAARIIIEAETEHREIREHRSGYDLTQELIPARKKITLTAVSYTEPGEVHNPELDADNIQFKFLPMKKGPGVHDRTVRFRKGRGDGDS